MSALTTRVFRLPDLGEGLTEAGLVQWLVAVGDTIVTDQAIAEVETAKSVVELPSPFAGVVTALHGRAGETIDVGAPVLEVAEAGAFDAGAESDGPAAADVEQEAYREEERAGSGNVLIGYGTSERASTGRGRARVRATRTSSAPTADAPVLDAAPRAMVAAPPPASASTSDTSSRRPVAVRSPLVRRLARDLGLDVHAIIPTGHDGAVTRADVLAAAVDDAVDGAAAQHRGSSAQRHDGSALPRVVEGEAIDGLAVVSHERLSPLRRAVSAKLTRSRSEIPEATVWVDVDATELWNLRAQMAPEGGRAPSVTALIARFVLLALVDHPVLGSRLSDDASELIAFDGVNLGVAADTAHGPGDPARARTQHRTARCGAARAQCDRPLRVHAT